MIERVPCIDEEAVEEWNGNKQEHGDEEDSPRDDTKTLWSREREKDRQRLQDYKHASR